MLRNDATRYEDFIKVAFGIKDGCVIQRKEDPAGLAEADYFRDLNNLPQVKVGTAYAVEIYNNYMLNNFSCNIEPEDFETMRGMTDRILAAADHEEIIDLIAEFESYIGKYCSQYSTSPVFEIYYQKA